MVRADPGSEKVEWMRRELSIQLEVKCRHVLPLRAYFSDTVSHFVPLRHPDQKPKR